MLVEIFVVVRRDITAGELRFNPLEELGVHSHHIFVVTMDWAILDHPDLAVALDNLRLNLADLFIHQVAPIFFAVDDGFTRLFDAIRTKRVGLPRPAEGGLGLFPRLQERLVRPLRSKRRIRVVLVEELNHVESDACCPADRPINRPQNLCAYSIRHKPLSPSFRSYFELGPWVLSPLNRWSRDSTTAPGLSFVCLKTVPWLQVHPISLWTP